ncbi:MAG: lipopolysaccharide kinase InaA family protein [Prevotella sp.]|jgi:serine/threonine protein kinase
MKITIKPEYEHLRAYIEDIPHGFNHRGKEIYNLRNIIKVMEAPDGQPLNVKQYHIPQGPNRLIYSWGIRKPKAQRAFEYSTILLSKGICTPKAIALIEERNALGLLRYTYFISEQISWGHTFYEFGNAQAGEYEEAARALARYAAYMHGQNVMHKDFTPGNILWKKDGEGYHFCLVDINRMHFGEVNIKMGLLNLIKFWGPKAFTEILISEYAKLRNEDPDKALAIAMPARAKFWRRYQRKHEIPFKLEL